MTGSPAAQYRACPSPTASAGWRKTNLHPGETQRVTITAEPRILAEYDTALPGWRIAGGTYRAVIARNAENSELTGEIILSERTMKP